MNRGGVEAAWTVEYETNGRRQRLELQGRDLQAVLTEAARFLADLERRDPSKGRTRGEVIDGDQAGV